MGAAEGGSSGIRVRPTSARPIETEYRPRRPVDVRRTVLYQRHGGGDPTMVVAGEVIWRASRTPEGIATLAIRETSPGVIRGAAWGPGAGWALAQLPALCGALDEPGDFDPTHHPLIAAAHHRNPGVRIGRTDVFFDSLASAIIEQKVTGMQAFAAWRRLVTWHGERAPGPTPRPMYAPPEHRRLADGAVLVVAPRRTRAAAGAHGRRGRTPRRGHRTRVHERDRRRSARPSADQPARHRARGHRPRPASAPSATPMPSASATSTSPTRWATPSPEHASTTTGCWNCSPRGRDSVSASSG